MQNDKEQEVRWKGRATGRGNGTCRYKHIECVRERENTFVETQKMIRQDYIFISNGHWT